ncbi:MAG TPA: ComEC/Rec2 family competence protein [Candidatus Paceibacterota bacterium]|jgi:competence protein ComEC|nr:ComEC/Rec2 family competence protein [Candidatus Paceibacterota bacterium]
MGFAKRYILHVVCAGLFVACLCIWSTVYAGSEQGKGKLVFAMLDIGQGDGLYIEGPTGIQIMVDAGPNTGAVLQELPKVMPLGDRTLNAVIETHPDADHMGGFIDVLERYKVGAFISPGIVKHNTVTDALDKEIAEQNIPTYVARRGMVLDLGGGAELDVLYPDQDVSDFGEKTNDGSIVARLVYGQTSVMLTGDAPFATEAHLIQISTSTDLLSDLLKVGHHGSKTSTSDAFIAAVHPSLALISVGANNTYGHPTQETLGRLQNAGVSVLRTDQKGAVVCVSDGAAFNCKSEK